MKSFFSDTTRYQPLMLMRTLQLVSVKTKNSIDDLAATLVGDSLHLLRVKRYTPSSVVAMSKKEEEDEHAAQVCLQSQKSVGCGSTRARFRRGGASRDSACVSTPHHLEEHVGRVSVVLVLGV